MVDHVAKDGSNNIALSADAGDLPRWSRCWPCRARDLGSHAVARRHSASHLTCRPTSQHHRSATAPSTPPHTARSPARNPPSQPGGVTLLPYRESRERGRRVLTSLDARHLRPVEAALRTPPPPGLENPRGPFTPAPTAAHDPWPCPTLPPRAGTSARPLSTADPLPELLPDCRDLT